MMKGRIKESKIPMLTKLLKMCKEMGRVEVYAYITSMELMRVKEEDLLPEVENIVGSTVFLDTALEADIQLFVYNEESRAEKNM